MGLTQLRREITIEWDGERPHMCIVLRIQKI